MSDNKYISPEHSIRNIISKKVGIVNELDLSREKHDTENMGEKVLGEGWYNPQTGKTYASKEESLKASEQLKTTEQAKKQSGLEQAAKAKQKELTQMGAKAQNQNVPLPKPPAGVGPQQAPKPKALPKPTETPMQILKPKSPGIGTNATKFAKGWGGWGAALGALDAGTTAYKEKKSTPEIVGATGAGAAEGGVGGLWMPLAGVSNAIEGTMKTLGLRKATPGETEAGKVSKAVNPEDEKEKGWAASALTGTAARRGVYNPADTAKPDIPDNVTIPDKELTDLEKMNLSLQAPLEQKRKFDTKHSVAASVPMAVAGAGLGAISGVLGAAEGGLAKYGETGIRSWEDAKKILKGAAWGGLKGFRSGAEMPYKTYHRVVGEEKTFSAKNTIKKVLSEAGLPKEKVRLGLKSILPKIHPSKIKEVDIDGHKLYDLGDGAYEWIDKNRKTVTPEIGETLNKKLLQKLEAEASGQKAPETAAVPEKKLSPYLTKQAQKLKGKAAGTELSNLPKFAGEPAFKLPELPPAEPAKVTSGPDLQKKKAVSPSEKEGAPYAPKPEKIEFKIAPMEPAKELPMAGAEPQLKIKKAEVKEPSKPFVVTDPRVDLKPVNLPKAEPKPFVVTVPRVDLKKIKVKKTEVKKPKPEEKKPKEKKPKEKSRNRFFPFGFGGGTPGQPAGQPVSVGISASGVPDYLHRAKKPGQYDSFSLKVEEKTRYDIENVARPKTPRKKATRQAEIIRKIIEEKKPPKKNETIVDTKPKLNTPEPGTN